MENKVFLGIHKLSKKCLMGLPAGLYLVSNCHNQLGPRTYTSVFYEYVAPHKERDIQWERIKAAHADSRNCYVYANAEEYKKSLENTTGKSAEFPKFVILEIDKSSQDSVS